MNKKFEIKLTKKSEVICWGIFLEKVRNLSKMGVGMFPSQNFGLQSDCIWPLSPLRSWAGRSERYGWWGFPSFPCPCLEATRPQGLPLLGLAPLSPCAYPPPTPRLLPSSTLAAWSARGGDERSSLRPRLFAVSLGIQRKEVKTCWSNVPRNEIGLSCASEIGHIIGPLPLLPSFMLRNDNTPGITLLCSSGHNLQIIRADCLAGRKKCQKNCRATLKFIYEGEKA